MTPTPDTPPPKTPRPATRAARPDAKTSRDKPPAKRPAKRAAKKTTAELDPADVDFAKSGTTYTARQRRAGVMLIERNGIAAAHAKTGIAKTTLSRWAKEAGVDVGANARAKTASAAAVVEARVVEAKLTTVTRLEGILEAELSTHARLAGLEATIGELLDDARTRVLNGERIVEAEVGAFGVPFLVFHDPNSQLGQLLGLLELAKVSKRDVVGAWTRAVHDLQLLRGEATERGDLVVRFGIPRPNAAASDAAAVDEDQLGTRLIESRPA